MLGYFATREEALEELAKHNKTKYNVDQRHQTFEQVYTSWAEIHYKDISDGTVRGYKTAYKHCKNLYKIKFCDIRAVHLQRTIDEDCKTYSIKKQVRVLINCLYKYAYDNDIVEKLYNKSINIGKETTVHEKKIFTDEEIKEKLWKNVDKIDGLDTILILNYTGLRVSEFLEIETENVHLDERYMVRTERKLKQENGRVIPIHTAILPYIKKRYNKDNKYLMTIDGKPVKYYEYKAYIFEPILQQLDITGITPHCTRHTFSTKIDEVEKYDKLGIKRILRTRNARHNCTLYKEQYRNLA